MTVGYPEEKGEAFSVSYPRKQPAMRSCAAAPLSNAFSPQESRQRLAAEAARRWRNSGRAKNGCMASCSCINSWVVNSCGIFYGDRYPGLSGGSSAHKYMFKPVVAALYTAITAVLSGLQTAIPVVRSFVTIAFRDERNPKIGQMCKERKQLPLHAHFPDF